MASEIRYRYKGKFITALKAQRIANLKTAKKFLKTEYLYKGKADVSRKGYAKPVSKLVRDALRKGEQAAVEKLKAKSRNYKVAESERRKRAKWKMENARARQLAADAVELIESADIPIQEALDRLAYDPAEYPGTSPEEIESMIEIAMDIDIAGLDFNMTDLESDERYG
jgi:hypothetical protein